MDDLRRELSESQLRVSILQDERNSWSSYFQSEGLEFNSPEALARALVQERVEKIAALEKAGRTNPELEEKNGIIQELEDKLAATRAEMEKMQESTTKDSKARQRLERQRALALKEAQFLRDQLKSFQAEETIYNQGNFDEQKNQRIEELEALLEEYKKEVEDLKASIKKFEIPATTGADGAGTKRSREDDEDNERIGQLSRKNRQLQDGTYMCVSSRKYGRAKFLCRNCKTYQFPWCSPSRTYGCATSSIFSRSSFHPHIRAERQPDLSGSCH